MIAFEKSVGAVVFRRQDGIIQYLLLHHRSSDKNSGHWDFPKGHMENAENEEETLRREVSEETGLTDLEIRGGFKRQIYYFYRATGREKENRLGKGRKINIFKRVKFFLAEALSGEVIISHEHDDFLWLPYDSAFERLTYKKAKKTLITADQFLQNKI